MNRLTVKSSENFKFSKIKFYWIKDNKLFFTINCYQKNKEPQKEGQYWVQDFLIENYDFPEIRDIKIKFKLHGAFKNSKIFELYYSQFFVEKQPVTIGKENMKLEQDIDFLEVTLSHEEYQKKQSILENQMQA